MKVKKLKNTTKTYMWIDKVPMEYREIVKRKLRKNKEKIREYRRKKMVIIK